MFRFQSFSLPGGGERGKNLEKNFSIICWLKKKEKSRGKNEGVPQNSKKNPHFFSLEECNSILGG